MKQFKKMLLMMMCVCVMLGCVACGNNNATDNGANQTENANGTDTTLDDVNDNTMNDATDGTDNANGTGDGVVGEMGEDVMDGVEDMGKDVEDAMDGNDSDSNIGGDTKSTGDVKDNGNAGNNGAENKEVPKDSKNNR